MKNLLETLNNIFYEAKVFEEYSILEGQEIINESFKSKLLSELAKEIHKAETKNREDDAKATENWRAQGYLGSPTPKAKTFASIFGPITTRLRYGDVKSGIQGLKWSEITDDDFTKYESDDKVFKKLLKAVYSKQQKADFICCAPDTMTPIYFIKGYGEKDGAQVFGFDNSGSWNSGVQEETAKKYKYDVRSLNYNEAISLIDGLDIYALVITQDMIMNYKNMHNDRLDSQKGVINYDEYSLKKILQDQQARYNVLVKKIKAEKLQSDPNMLFDEIKKVNDEVVELFKEVMKSPENMDKRFDLSGLMNYVNYAYDMFYRYASSLRASELHKERAKQRAKDRGEEFDDAKYAEYDFDKTSAEEQIRDSKSYLEKVKKMIKEIKDQL